MDKEFNPTKKDLLTIESLIIGIKQKKSVEVAQKTRYENTLSQLKDKYKDVDFNSPDFKRIKSTRQNIKNYLQGIEVRIKTLNDELSFKNKLKLEIEYHLRHNKTPDEQDEATKKVVKKIQTLKLKYSEFAKDRTRIASLRVIASEFVDELNEVIDFITK